jgi:hypothetical protein
MDNKEVNKCNNICEELENFVPSDSYHSKYMSELQRAVLSNDIDKVSSLLKNGHRIYQNDMLCNSFYRTFYFYHPKECQSSICFRTSMYYALWLNVVLSSLLFIQILKLLNNSPCLHFRSEEDKRKVKEKELSDVEKMSYILQEIYEGMIKLEDSKDIVQSYQKFYNHNSLKFSIVYKLMQKIPELLQFSTKRYGCHMLENISFESVIVHLNNNRYTLPSWRKYLGNMYVFLDKGIVVNHDIQDELVGNIKMAYDEYIKNTRIVKLMFDQQAYEYFKYHLDYKPYDSIKVLHLIRENPLVDTDYVYEYENNNILSYTLKKDNLKELILMMFNKSNKLPDKFEIIEIIRKNYLDNIKEVIRYCDISYLNQPYFIFSSILNLRNVRSSDKLEIIRIFTDRGALDNIKGIIDLVLKHDLSHTMIKIVLNREEISKGVTLDDIILALELRKQRELDILIDNSPQYLNPKAFKLYLPNIYLNKINGDNSVGSMDLLDVILEKQKNLEYTDEFGKTVLIKAVNADRTRTVDRLLKAGADPFHKDDERYNVLHYAIMNQQMKILELLYKCKNNSDSWLVDEVYEGYEYPLHMMVNCKNPVMTLDILGRSGKMDYTVRDVHGDNILHYIIGADISVWTKEKLISRIINVKLNLLENSKTDGKPIVIRAVEREYYNIVIIIMNKLIELGNVNVKGISDEDKVGDIEGLLRSGKNINIVPIDPKEANFYPLVTMYIKNNIGHKQYVSKNLINLTNFLMIALIFVVTFRTLHNYNHIRQYYIMKEGGLFDNHSDNKIKSRKRI